MCLERFKLVILLSSFAFLFSYTDTNYYFLKAGHIGEAITMCTEVLENDDPNDLDVLCDRAEAYLIGEQFDEGPS